MIRTLSRLQAFMTGRKALLPGALAVSALSSLAGLLPYVFIWFIVREFFRNDTGFSQNQILNYAWWAVGSAVAGVILYFIALSLSHLAAFRVEVRMRGDAMRKIVSMPLGFFDKNTTGRIRKIIDENAGITHGFLAHQMPDLAGTITVLIALVIMIFAFDWRLGLACIVPVALAMTIMSFMMQGASQKFMKLYMNSLEEMNSEAVEYVRGIPVVKVFQQTIYSFKNFYNSIIRYREMVTKHVDIWELPMSAYTVIINGIAFFLVPTAILLTGNTGVYKDILLNLFLYALITPMFTQFFMRSMYLIQAAGQAGEAVNRVDNLLSSVPPLPLPVHLRKMCRYDIRFDKVSFKYPGAADNAINGISFTVPSNSTVALVGASGSGKTTIARLIPRFWDVTQGQVSIGGIDVREIDPSDLMQHISFVFQNTRLFKTSLLENIRFGNPSASRQEVELAVDAAQCREIIERLPDGLETRIGTDGTWLSGGEQQRIVLARAIIKNAPIVVLDEATAFTDPENEHLIQMALGRLTRGKTVIMIAHRLTSVVDADMVLVIEKGKIAEQGKHQQLVDMGGMYSRMWSEYHKSVSWTVKEGCVQ